MLLVARPAVPASAAPPVVIWAGDPVRPGDGSIKLVLGKDARGGDPPKDDTPGLYAGLLDEVKDWTRALRAEEVKTKCDAGR